MKLIVCFFCVVFSLSAWSQKGVFVTPEAFQKQAFPEGEGMLQALWLTQGLRTQASSILDHAFVGLRVRYWAKGTRTAWILEEIGKELPITVGVIIENNAIQQMVILAFRESRGGEVRHSFFTRQFIELGLIRDPSGFRLSGGVDGITGATMSVRAVKKVATLALFFHHQTPYSKVNRVDVGY